MRFLPLIAMLLAGCSSSNPMKLPWNSRTQEQARMNAAVEEKQDGRGEQLLQHDPDKVFPLSQANVTGARSYSTGKANSGEFHFIDRVRTRAFRTGEYATKGAWMGDYKYDTKEAPTRESRYAGMSAPVKGYDTRESREANKAAPVRAAADGSRPFLVQGRRQADFDRHGPASQIPGQSWDGNLTPMTIEEVRKLLNKN